MIEAWLAKKAVQIGLVVAVALAIAIAIWRWTESIRADERANIVARSAEEQRAADLEFQDHLEKLHVEALELAEERGKRLEKAERDLAAARASRRAAAAADPSVEAYLRTPVPPVLRGGGMRVDDRGRP